MSFMKNLILFFFIFTILFSANTYAATFVIQNQCRYSVWAAAVPGGGVQLAQSQSWTLNVTAGTVGRIWGRTGCNFDAKGQGSCRTGDCNGTLQCRGYGKPPNTLAEFAVNQYSNLDFFDMSLVDGFNIPMDFSPTSNGCTPGINCTADINGQCPTVLRAPGGCNNPCTVFKTNQYCCTSGSCSPTNFSRFFKDRCPDAYSYPKDDQSSTFTCPAGTNYQVVFCPLLSNPRLSPPTPAMSLSPSRTPRPPPLLLQAPPPAMTHSPSPNTTRGRNLMWTIVGTSVSIVFVALLAGSYLCYRCLCKDSDQDARQPLNLGGRNNKAKSEELPLIRLDVIKTATQNFSDTNKLGQGGFGPVYKGVLADGKEIAVKRLSKTSGQGLQEFKNEITLIAKLQHRNLVRLLGCCLEAKESLLIYEYMPNKSLDVILFDPRRCAEIDWKQRLVIINGIARGLLYLHEDSRLRIIHRDLKTSNVLLDNDMIPKISDFGMARIFGVDQVEANTNRVVGTYGYMAPEYAMEGLFSVKSDVYSFGVLLLEIISGKRNGGAFVAQHGENLLTHVWKLWGEGRGLELMDPSLEETYTESEVLKCIQIGLLCVQDDPADRPTMSYVAALLRSDNYRTLPQPTQPLFPVKRLVRKPTQLLEPSLNDLTISNISPR